MQVQYFGLVFVEKHAQGFLKEVDSLEKEADVKLLLYLFPAFVDDFHVLPSHP